MLITGTAFAVVGRLEAEPTFGLLLPIILRLVIMLDMKLLLFWKDEAGFDIGSLCSEIDGS